MYEAIKRVINSTLLLFLPPSQVNGALVAERVEDVVGALGLLAALLVPEDQVNPVVEVPWGAASGG